MDELNRCRLCFSSNNLTDAIFPASSSPNDELMEMIYACTSIRICFERDFPCPICSSCVRIVNQFHAYRRKCLKNDRELKQMRGHNDSGGLEDPGEEEDPLGSAIKQEGGGYDQQFYGQVKQQIRNYLETQSKEIERKALAKVNEALKNRRGESGSGMDIGLQMTVEEAGQKHPQETFSGFEDISGLDCSQLNEGQETGYGNRFGGDGVDWKDKYLTLQRNNDLLQKAFREQKTKVRNTEQLLKVYQQHGVTPGSSNSPDRGGSMEMVASMDHNGWIGSFTVHPSIPEISVEFLQCLNYKSGPGDKGDRNFVSKLAVAVFGVDILVNSSVTGRPSNAHHNIPAKPPLCPQKIAAIGLKLFERVQQEVGTSNQEELLARSSEKIVRLIVCQKSMNLRKQIVKRTNSVGGGANDAEAGGSGAGSGGDDDSGPVEKKMMLRLEPSF